MRQDREAFATKIQNLNSSIELRSIETTANQSNKSKSKPSAAYIKSLSGSKTSTAENKSISAATNAYQTLHTGASIGFEKSLSVERQFEGDRKHGTKMASKGNAASSQQLSRKSSVRDSNFSSLCSNCKAAMRRCPKMET